MKVLSVGNMYPPHHLGGYELMWRSWVHHMRAAGHEVRVLTTDYVAPRPDPAIPEDDDVHRNLRWYWQDHDFPAMNAFERLTIERHNARSLRHHMRDFAPDVVSWWAMGGMSLSLIEQVRRAGLPAHATVVDDWLVYGPSVDAWQRAIRRSRLLASAVGAPFGIPSGLDLSAVHWTFVSETVRRHAERAGLKVSASSVVPAGIEDDAFEPADPTPWRGRLLCLGRIDERKGIAIAIRALELLPSETSLEVVGSGDEAYLRELEADVRDRGLARRVGFRTVTRAEVPGVYASADVTLFPVQWEEPWGLVPLESMAVGTPVVATGAGGSGEYLEHEVNALIFEPRNDPKALAVAVERLARDDALRTRLRAGGLATANRFGATDFNRAIEAELERVVG